MGKSKQLCIIKRSELESAETGESFDHKGTHVLMSMDYAVTPITLGDGATLVDRSVWEAHKSNPNRTALEPSLKVYQSAAEAHEDMRSGDLAKVIAVTTHGQLLREFLAIEQARNGESRPRRVILDALSKRIRLYGDHAPIQFLTSAALPKLRQMSAGARA